MHNADVKPGQIDVNVAVTCASLSKRYGRVPALDALDLRVPRGAAFGVLGPNGAGKSTLLRLLLGFMRPSAGSITVLGERRVERVRPRIGYLPERPHYDGLFTAREYLQALGSLRGLGGRPLAQRIEELLALCGLDAAADRRLHTYSKGMLQRIGLAQALLGRPELLVLDEPSSGLDPGGQWEMRKLIGRIHAAGCTLLLCSHALIEVQQLCTHAAILQGGRLAWSGEVGGSALIEPRVRIELADLDERVRALLADLPSVTWRGAAVELAEREQGAALRRLLDAGIPIRSLNPVRRSLEEVYLQATATAPVAAEEGAAG